MKQSKRIFIGIPLQPQLIEAINHIKKGYPEIKGVRWTRLSNLHITLSFIGSVEIDKLDSLINQIVDTSEKFNDFPLTFRSLKIIKKKGTPVMFWAVYNKNEVYNEIHNYLHKNINKIVTLKEEHKELIPHITMARIKLIKEKSIPALPEDIFLPDINVDRIVLWESILLPNGPEYKPLKIINFK